jgi:hypothetical protein
MASLVGELVKSRLGVFQHVLNLVRPTQFGTSPNKPSAYPDRRRTALRCLFETTLGCIFRRGRLITLLESGGFGIHGPGADLVVFRLPAMLPRVQAMRLGCHWITEVVRQPGQDNAQRAGVAVQLPSFTERVPLGKKWLLAVTSGSGPGVAGWPVGCGLVDCHRPW